MNLIGSGTHHRESRHLVAGYTARRWVPGSRTVLGGKGPLRRGTNRRALASCAPFCVRPFATGGSAGNQMQRSFFVLRKTRTR